MLERTYCWNAFAGSQAYSQLSRFNSPCRSGRSPIASSMVTYGIRSKRPGGSSCVGGGKCRLNIEPSPDEEDAVTELRYTIVGRTKGVRNEPIAGTLERQFDRRAKRSPPHAQESLHVFHHKKTGLQGIDESDKLAELKIARVVLDPLPVRAEPLATRAACKKMDSARSNDLADLILMNRRNVALQNYRVRVVCAVGADRMTVDIDPQDRGESPLAADPRSSHLPHRTDPRKRADQQP